MCVDRLYFFSLDKILSIDKSDSMCFHGSLQCIVIQKFSLNVVQSSKFIQVLILTKNHHFSKLVLIYGITTMKSTYHSNGSSSYSVIQNLIQKMYKFYAQHISQHMYSVYTVLQLHKIIMM